MVFSLASCICFFPSRTISGDLKRMKETTVTKLECMKTIPPPHRGLGTDPTTLYLPLSSPLPSSYTFIATQANSALAPWPKGRWLDLLGP